MQNTDDLLSLMISENKKLWQNAPIVVCDWPSVSMTTSNHMVKPIYIYPRLYLNELFLLASAKDRQTDRQQTDRYTQSRQHKLLQDKNG